MGTCVARGEKIDRNTLAIDLQKALVLVHPLTVASPLQILLGTRYCLGSLLCFCVVELCPDHFQDTGVKGRQKGHDYIS